MWLERPCKGVDLVVEKAKQREAFEKWLAGVQHNALGLPDCEFDVWLENSNLVEGYYLPRNVRVRHPQEIEAYRDGSVPVAKDLSLENSWARVDTVRMMVLQQAMIEMRSKDGPKKAAYFDGDVDLIDDGESNCVLVENCLFKHGFAVGGVRPVTVDGRVIDRSNCDENGFMAASVLDTSGWDEIIPEILKKVNREYKTEGVRGYNGVWQIYSKELFNYCWARRDVSNLEPSLDKLRHEIGSIPIQPPPGQIEQRPIGPIKIVDYELWSGEHCETEELTPRL